MLRHSPGIHQSPDQKWKRPAWHLKTGLKLLLRPRIGPPCRLKLKDVRTNCRTSFLCDHWLTPLAKNPPSTTRTSPLTKRAASEERNTAAPANSSTFPNRFIGVRNKNSRPRSVSSSSFWLSAV